MSQSLKADCSKSFMTLKDEIDDEDEKFYKYNSDCTKILKKFTEKGKRHLREII